MIAKKLRVREGSRVAVIGAPASIDLVLPPGAVAAGKSGPADIVLTYATRGADVRRALGSAGNVIAEGGVLWVAYPKAGQLGTDLNRDVLARALQAEGLEPVAQIALDLVWSALRVTRDEALSESRRTRRTFAAGPKKKTNTSPKKKTNTSPKKKTNTSPKKKTTTSPKRTGASKLHR